MNDDAQLKTEKVKGERSFTRTPIVLKTLFRFSVDKTSIHCSPNRSSQRRKYVNPTNSRRSPLSFLPHQTLQEIERRTKMLFSFTTLLIATAGLSSVTAAPAHEQPSTEILVGPRAAPRESLLPFFLDRFSRFALSRAGIVCRG